MKLNKSILMAESFRRYNPVHTEGQLVGKELGRKGSGGYGRHLSQWHGKKDRNGTIACRHYNTTRNGRQLTNFWKWQQSNS